MPSWSDALSPQGRQDMQSLIDTAIAAGRKALSNSGVITPIPFLMTINGDVLQLSADQIVAPGTPAQQQADGIVDALRKASAAGRAAALVTSTRLAKENSDAVEVWAEHSEGAALTLIQPFHRSLLGGVVEFGALAAYPGQQRVWG